PSPSARNAAARSSPPTTRPSSSHPSTPGKTAPWKTPPAPGLTGTSPAPPSSRSGTPEARKWAQPNHVPPGRAPHPVPRPPQGGGAHAKPPRPPAGNTTVPPTPAASPAAPATPPLAPGRTTPQAPPRSSPPQTLLERPQPCGNGVSSTTPTWQDRPHGA